MAERSHLPTVATPALLAVAVLLVGSLSYNLAHLDTGPELLPPIPPLGGLGSGPGGNNTTAGDGESTRAFFTTLFWGVVGFGIAMVLLVKFSGGKLGRLVTVWELLGYGLVILVILVLVLNWGSISGTIRGVVPTTSRGPAGPPGFGAEQSEDRPTGLALLVVAVAAIVLVATFAPLGRYLRRDRTTRSPPSESPRAVAARALGRTIRDLQAGGPYREAVIRCYSELCAILATRGLRRQDSLTAREIEALALRQVGLSQGSVDSLTGLFEEARYSRHEIGPRERDAALSALASIKSELEAVPSASA